MISPAVSKPRPMVFKSKLHPVCIRLNTDSVLPTIKSVLRKDTNITYRPSRITIQASSLEEYKDILRTAGDHSMNSLPSIRWSAMPTKVSFEVYQSIVLPMLSKENSPLTVPTTPASDKCGNLPPLPTVHILSNLCLSGSSHTIMMSNLH